MRTDPPKHGASANDSNANESVNEKSGSNCTRNDARPPDPAAAQDEEALRASAIRYRRLFDAAKDGILILEAHTGFIMDANPFLLELLGYSHAELVGIPIWELGPFRDIVSNRTKFEQLQQQGYVRYDHLPLETRDGRRIPVEFVSNVYDEAGHDVIQCNIRDITERQRAEEQLRASYREIADLKAALDEHAIVAITDPQGKMTYVNDKFCAISQYSREELLGQDHRIVNSGHHPKEFMANLWNTITRGKVWRAEIKNKAKDDSFYWEDTTIVPFLNAEGKPRQYVAIHADITERKQAEEIIRQFNVELEQRVMERTAQLEDANQELQAFSYSVSHDLRAPLRHVLGFVDLLQREAGASLSGDCRLHLTTIVEAVKRMQCLIDDLLGFARIGHAEMQKTEVNLNELVRAVVGDCLVDAQGRNLAWDIHPLPIVRADASLLRVVLANLISNAVKFTSARADATIKIGCAPSGNSETVIYIRDNGAGFESRYAHRLFGVFQRLHSHHDFEGTGIGLAMVRRIIHRHGGRTWAEGAVNSGATFYFSIPKQA